MDRVLANPVDFLAPGAAPPDTPLAAINLAVVVTDRFRDFKVVGDALDHRRGRSTAAHLLDRFKDRQKQL